MSLVEYLFVKTFLKTFQWIFKLCLSPSDLYTILELTQLVCLLNFSVYIPRAKTQPIFFFQFRKQVTSFITDSNENFSKFRKENSLEAFTGVENLQCARKKIFKSEAKKNGEKFLGRNNENNFY